MCGCNGGSASAAASQKWIYQSPDGKRTEYTTQIDANLQVTRNGGGTVYKKP